ncbi:MAG: hypothetical protein CMH50_13865 [Myxococcales bacterium]|nr:hypothetical protein [Myxococcales bacterium]
MRICLLLCLVWGVAGVAKEPDGGSDPSRSADEATDVTVVVTGTREEQRMIEMPRAVESTDRETIEKRGTMDAAEALAALPGVSIQELNPGGAAPVLRGLTGPDLLILVDGIDFSTPLTRPGPDNRIGTIGLFSVERLEVIRGGSSVLSGAGGMGGVVNVLTRDLEQPDDKWWRWREFFGFHGENRYNFTTLLKYKKPNKRLSYLLAVQRDKFRSRNIGGLFAGETDHWRPLSDRGQWDGLLKARYEGKNYDLVGGYLGMQVKGGGRLDQLTRGRVSRQHQNDQFAWLKYKGRAGRILAHRTFHVAWRDAQEEQVEQLCEGHVQAQVANERRCWNRLMPEEDQDANTGPVPIPVLGTREQSLRTQGWQVGMTGRFRDWGRLRSRVGLLVKSDTVTQAEGVNDGQATFPLPLGATHGRATAFLHGRYTLSSWGAESPFPRSLKLQGGFRAVNAFTEVLSSDHGAAATQRTDPGLVGEFQVVFNRQGRGATWLGWSQGFRSPNLSERYFQGSDGELSWQMNEGLQSQSSNTFEVGSRRKSPRWTYSWSLYHSQVAGLLDPVEVTPSSFQLINASQARFTGFDMSLLLKARNFHHLHQASWTQGAVDRVASGETVVSLHLPPIQGRHLLHLGAAKAAHGLQVYADWALPQTDLHPVDKEQVRYCGRADASDCSGGEAWWTLGARWFWKYSKRAQGGLRIDNLLDRRYRRHGSGVHAAGFNLRSEVEVEF